jgi:hypothetical protein
MKNLLLFTFLRNSKKIEFTKPPCGYTRQPKFLNLRSNKQTNQNQLLDYHLVLYQSHISLWDGRDREAYNPLLQVKSVLAPKSNSCKQQPTTTLKNKAFWNIIRVDLNPLIWTADLTTFIYGWFLRNLEKHCDEKKTRIRTISMD